MPISKDKVLELAKRDYSQVFATIDELLLDQADDLLSSYNKRIVIHTSDLGNKFSQGTAEHIMLEYQKQGWKVTYHSSQKDGDWLEFK